MTLEEPDQQRRAFVLKSPYILEGTNSLNNGQKAVIKLAAPAVSLGKVMSDRDASSIANFFQ